MKKQYELIVVIGRFQPIHIGHEYNINKAKELADKVLVLIGSASTARSPKNPWTYTERKKMIQMPFPFVDIESLEDYIYDENLWLAEVQTKVAELDIKGKIGILGHDKDSSSYYLHSFPDWEFIDTGEWYPETYINATDIRNHFFDGKFAYLGGVLSERVGIYLAGFAQSEEYPVLKEEYNFNKTYKPEAYPVIVQTVDSVVIQSGHILLVERKFAPGKGLWALPGGHLEVGERLYDAAVRELTEETKIKVTDNILKGSYKRNEYFDSPSRSERARVITQVFLFELDDSKPLPDIRGNDDAKEARWIPFNEFLEMESQMFEDHWAIAQSML